RLRAGRWIGRAARPALEQVGQRRVVADAAVVSAERGERLGVVRIAPQARDELLRGGVHSGADTLPRMTLPLAERASSGREARHPPAIALAHVDEAVVQAMRSVLPVLDAIGNDPVAAPVGRTLDRTAL